MHRFLEELKDFSKKADWVLLTLCLILPQGFLVVGCAGQMDIVSAFLLCAALTLLDGEGHPLAAMLVYGAAAAMSGAALPSLRASWKESESQA